ncbi:hypothetical protein [Candidatus Endomicrobiellum trichonymphae]|uniref:hypothetical protein n=1 Tax=Endomicrobium trichonymphae TaxID=1408204 RepID=UPI000BBB38B9|nr:hypothetical protein [Candidatus Endomicrobium trichonymphae]
MRFAQWKIVEHGWGVVGIITNNSWLNGITHRQMRKSLMETFDEIYILNLHGNTRKGENDKNISVLADNIVTGNEKLNLLETKTLSSLKWKKLNPQETGNYFFIPHDLKEENIYNSFF